MKMWIARNSDNTLELFKVKPKTFYEEGIGQYWAGGYAYFLPANQFPEVTFENSPQDVELVLPSQEPTIGDLLNQLMELNKEYKEFRMLVGLMRHAQTYGDKQSSFQESAVDHFIKTHNIDWD